MTNSDRTQLEKDVLHEEHTIRRDYEASRIKIQMYGEQLVTLGEAMRFNPEDVTPLPEPQNIDAGKDYRDGLNLLNRREEIVSLCKEAADLGRKLKILTRRKASLGL